MYHKNVHKYGGKEQTPPGCLCSKVRALGSKLKAAFFCTVRDKGL